MNNELQSDRSFESWPRRDIFSDLTPVPPPPCMQGPAKKSWRTLPIGERLTHSLVNGISEFVDQDTEEARKELPAPLDVSQGSQ